MSNIEEKIPRKSLINDSKFYNNAFYIRPPMQAIKN